MNVTDKAELRLCTMICLGVFASALDMAVVNVALPSMARTLSAGLAEVGWVASSYAFALAGTVALFGLLSDRVGRLKIFRSGVVIFAAASLGCGVAASLPWLVAARCLQGAGAAMLQATASALVTDLARPARRGPLLSNVGMAIAAGMLLGPCLGGLVVSAVGWAWIFFANVPVCLLALWAGGCWKEGREARRPVDPAPALSALWGGQGAACLANLGTAVAFGGCTGVTLLLPPTLLETHAGLAPWQVGGVVCAVLVGMLASTKLTGAAVRAVGPRPLMGGGLATMLLAVAILGGAQGAREAWRYFPALFLYGAGGGVFQTPSILELLGRTPAAFHGLVGALQRMAQSLGVALGGSWAAWAWREALGDGAAASRAGWGGAGGLLLGAWMMWWQVAPTTRPCLATEGP